MGRSVSPSIANELNTADISDFFEVGHTEKSTSNCFLLKTNSVFICVSQFKFIFFVFFKSAKDIVTFQCVKYLLDLLNSLEISLHKKAQRILLLPLGSES